MDLANNNDRDSVASLSLKTRTYNALVKGRFSGPISTISELVQLSEDDLYRRRGMGPRTVADIKASLAERGFFSPPTPKVIGKGKDVGEIVTLVLMFRPVRLAGRDL
jgi:hypothetical protein